MQASRKRRPDSRGSLEARTRTLVREMDETEVDKLHGVIVQYEDVAGFHIAVNEPDIMSGL